MGFTFANDFAKSIFELRYAFDNTETWEDACMRVASHVAKAELPEKQSKYQQEFYNELVEGRFMPGGRIWYGSGRNKAQLLNCFVLGGTPEDDSREGWGKLLHDSLIISGTGGGIGINFSEIRPRGVPIKGTGGIATGAVSFMRIVNAVCEEIKAGGARRSALMFCLNHDHPDIMEFLSVKLDLGELNNANISIVFMDESPEDFFQKVKNDADHDLIWKGKVVKTIKAKQLWDKLVINALKNGEPGILNFHLFNKMNNIPYARKLVATNPCITGETLVAVADGRKSVSIKELADKGDDVAVYCLDNDGKLAIKMMRHPRITGYNEAIFKVILDDGSTIRATANHKFMLRNGTYKEVKDLEFGDSLKLAIRNEFSIKDVIPKSNSNSQDYFWWSLHGKKGFTLDHRLIAEYFYRPINKGEVVHHKDFNAQNNAPDNLEIMTKEAHDLYHSQFMFGDNNPMRRAQTEWSEEKWANYKLKHSINNTGLNNKNAINITNEEIYQKALELTKELGHRFSQQEWYKYAKQNNLPMHFTQYRQHELGNTTMILAKKVAIELGLDFIDVDPRVVKTYQKALEQNYDAEIINGYVFIKKQCENCNNDFTNLWIHREISFCSTKCSNIKLQSIEAQKKARETQRKIYASKKITNRENQLEVYTELKAKNGIVFKKEWENTCRSLNIPFRLGYKGSPFQTFGELKEAAITFNHRVISVEFDGYENVYNGTVDEYHNFLVGNFEFVNNKGKKSNAFLINRQCGEIGLTKSGNCCLGAIVLPRFIKQDSKAKNIKDRLDWEGLHNTIARGVRFLDDVLTVNHYPIPETEIEAQAIRRLGLGVMGLHDMLLMLGLKYSSQEGRDFVDKIMSFIKHTAYDTSTYLALEKGPFPEFNAEKVVNSGFVKTLKPSVRNKIRDYGLRNCAIMTIAPCGTTSIVQGVTSGIEPIFALAYNRRYQTTNEEGYKELKSEVVVHPLFEQFVKDGLDVSHFEGSDDISPRDHFAMQATCQMHVDNAISKTVNIPQNEYTPELLSDLYMEFVPVLKGTTIYPVGSRENTPLDPIPLEQAYALVMEGKTKSEEEAIDSCKSGSCGL